MMHMPICYYYFLNSIILGDRREAHLFKLIKSFVEGKCHPAMTSIVKLCTNNSLHVSQSNTTLGSQRPSVFGAYTYSQLLGFSSDTDDTDTLLMLSYQTVNKSQVQGAENGPEPQFSKSYRIMHEVHNAELYSARCLTMMSSSDCIERRKQQQQSYTIKNNMHSQECL